MADEIKLDAEGKPIAAPPQPTPTPPPKGVLEGDDIPETFRGKPAKELVDSLLVTQTELERLKSETSQKEAALQAELQRFKPQVQLTDEEREAQEEKAFFQKPSRFIKQQFDERVKPIADEYYGSQAQVQKEIFRAKTKDFAKYEKKIDEMMAKMPAELKAKSETWGTVYKLAKIDDLEEREKQLETKEKELRVKSGLHVEGEGAPAGEPAPRTTLSDEEKSVAKTWGMSDEDYLKWKDNYYGT